MSDWFGVVLTQEMVDGWKKRSRLTKMEYLQAFHEEEDFAVSLMQCRTLCYYGQMRVRLHDRVYRGRFLPYMPIENYAAYREHYRMYGVAYETVPLKLEWDDSFTDAIEVELVMRLTGLQK